MGSFRLPLCRWLVAAVLVLGSAFPSRVAFAVPDALVKCDAIWALEDLPLADRDRLFLACRSEPIRRNLVEALTSDEDIRDVRTRQLMDAVQRVTTRAWQAALLVSLLYNHEKANVPSTADDAGRRPFMMCPPLAAKLEKYISSNNSAGWIPDFGLRRQAIETEKACGGVLSNIAGTQPAQKGTSYGTKALVVFYALGEERVSFLYGGTRPGLLSPTRIMSHPATGRVVYAGWVPRQVPVVIVTEGRLTGPQGFRTIVQGDFEHWSAAESLVCVDLQVAGPPGSAVLIDGFALETSPSSELSRILYLPQESHQLTVLAPRTAARARRVVLANQVVEANEIKGAFSCHRIRLDLRTHIASATTGLLSVRAAPSCLEAGVDVARVRHHTMEHLEAIGADPRDFETWGESITGLSELRESIARLGGTRVGATRGRTDSWDLLGSAASELQRQGFQRVIWLELYCSRREQGWDYSFVARQVSLHALLEKARDPLTGMGLEGVVTSEIEVVTDRRQLAKGIEAPLARILNVPSIKFQDLQDRYNYHDYVGFGVDVFVPPADGARYRAMARARALGDGRETALCSSIDAASELRRVQRPLSGSWDSAEQSELLPATGQRELSLHVTPTQEGTYLVEAALVREDGEDKRETVAASYRCIQIRKPLAEFFIDLSRQWSGLPFVQDDWNVLQDARPETYSATWVLLGMRFRRTPVGFAIGFMHVDRSGQTPPSFDDLRSANFDMNGLVRYTVRENSLIFGPVVQFDTSVCQLTGTLCDLWWRRFSLAFRGLFLAQATFVDRAEIPERLIAFRDPELSGDTRAIFDAGPFLQGGFAMQLSSTVSVAGLFDLGVPRLGQMLFQTSKRSFQFDGRFVSGLSLSVGASL